MKLLVSSTSTNLGGSAECIGVFKHSKIIGHVQKRDIFTGSFRAKRYSLLPLDLWAMYPLFAHLTNPEPCEASIIAQSHFGEAWRNTEG